ncbi:hypothetical protein C7C46_19730 [Streptomyces tateyamensis]|uniref:Secreted protein n=1 Tax=Streptomyces tateyamensis TaxID=565073 RepID=A0A2V4P364_9ACTN|nr:hypothetical protein [Streptomyces tateyamensis]PYC77203.1 hypothetical protein C7C46_19730 [Streptomyces tateyamensis]
MKLTRRTTTRLGAGLAAVAAMLTFTAVTAPAAQAWPTTMCRTGGAYYSNYDGIAINPCIHYIWGYDGANDWVWQAEASVYSPRTDIRFYMQQGWSQTATSPISWDGPAVSQVVGPDSNWHYIAQPNGSVDTTAGCWWARAWATNSGQTVVGDVESAPICT